MCLLRNHARRISFNESFGKSRIYKGRDAKCAIGRANVGKLDYETGVDVTSALCEVPTEKVQANGQSSNSSNSNSMKPGIQ